MKVNLMNVSIIELTSIMPSTMVTIQKHKGLEELNFDHFLSQNLTLF